MTAPKLTRAKSILSGISVHVLTPRTSTARVSTEPAAQPSVAPARGVHGFIEVSQPWVQLTIPGHR